MHDETICKKRPQFKIFQYDFVLTFLDSLEMFKTPRTLPNNLETLKMILKLSYVTPVPRHTYLKGYVTVRLAVSGVGGDHPS